VRTHLSIRGESFTPYASPFVGGTNSKGNNLTVTLLEGKVQTFVCCGGGTESRGMTQDVPKK
jgi:hypothetical protein